MDRQIRGAAGGKNGAMSQSFASLLPALETAARQAGALILDVYAGDFAVESKADDSPVTEADRQAETLILSALADLAPGVPIIAEEEAAAGRLPAVGSDPFWLVDPLDGTKEFVKRSGEFTVNIGLVAGGVPVLGVVFAPALGWLWSAAGTATVVDPDGFRRPLTCRPIPETEPVVLASRLHGSAEALERFLSTLRRPSIARAGSSLKFCRIAEGAADFYPRFGPTSEWDTAAGHAVLVAAGGSVTLPDGAPFTYGKPGFLNRDGFLAQGTTPPGV